MLDDDGGLFIDDPGRLFIEELGRFTAADVGLDDDTFWPFILNKFIKLYEFRWADDMIWYDPENDVNSLLYNFYDCLFEKKF